MPKVPAHEWRNYTDPDSPEYEPTTADIESDRKNAEAVRNWIERVKHEIKNSAKDKSWDDEWGMKKESFLGIAGPNDLSEDLFYLEDDHLNRIKDQILKEEIKKELSVIEQKICQQFIPFIESKIDLFGLTNSPLEETKGRKIETEEILEYLAQARSTLKQVNLDEDEGMIFLSELERLEQKFDRYLGEPTLSTFERMEKEWFKEVSKNGYLELGDGWLMGKVAGTLYDEDANKRNALKLDLLLTKAYRMKEIADRMLRDETKSDCESRAESYIKYIEELKTAHESPKEMLSLEAEMKDFFERLKNGESADKSNLGQLELRISELKNRWGADQKKIEKILKLFAKIKKMISGESIDEDEYRFDFTGKENIDWAWSLLGVERNCSDEEVKKAYRTMAMKYHPDRNKTKDAVEKMKKINKAYELLKER
jgi:hypothetical protein